MIAQSILLLLIITSIHNSKIVVTSEEIQQQPSLNTYRLFVTQQNLKIINKHNADPSRTFQMKPYPQFIALTLQEFRQRHLSTPQLLSDLQKIKITPPPLNPTQAIKKPLNPTPTAPITVDLTSLVQSTVYSQNKCGNCYAFSTVDGINMNNALKSRNIPTLSIQQLTDCSANTSLPYYNYGCEGGTYTASMWYNHIHGLVSATYYPLNRLTYSSGVDQPCQALNSRVTRYKISGWYSISAQTGLCITRASFLYNNYPVSTQIYASTPNFIYYSSGIINSCPPSNQVDHAVLMVGFRYDGTFNGSYFKIKNSWGTTWGQGGYFLISMVNTCNICSYSVSSL